MFYVEYCRSGVNVSYESMGGRAFSVYAFETQRDRAEWLEDNAEDLNGKWVARKYDKRAKRVGGKQMIMLDKWISGCKVEVHNWIDGKHIYVNVRYFLSGSSIDRPAWDKSVLVTDTPKGRSFVLNYTEALVTGVSRMPERKTGSKMPIITLE